MDLEDLKNKHRLLEQYVSTLQRENKAKNTQTALLYSKIQQLTSENNKLTLQIQTQKEQYQKNTANQQKQIDILQKQNQDLQNSLDQLQRQLQICKNNTISKKQYQKIKNIKQQQLTLLSQQNNQYKNNIIDLQKNISILTTKCNQFQQKKKKYTKKIKQLEQNNLELKDLLESTAGNTQNSFTKLDIDKLIKDNNQLIQKVRLLEKQKNQYYVQLKSVSPLKQKKQRNDQSRRKTMTAKTQHWNIMQEKINAIRTENEQIKANLIIR